MKLTDLHPDILTSVVAQLAGSTSRRHLSYVARTCRALRDPALRRLLRNPRIDLGRAERFCASVLSDPQYLCPMLRSFVINEVIFLNHWDSYAVKHRRLILRVASRLAKVFPHASNLRSINLQQLEGLLEDDAFTSALVGVHSLQELAIWYPRKKVFSLTRQLSSLVAVNIYNDRENGSVDLLELISCTAPSLTRLSISWAKAVVGPGDDSRMSWTKVSRLTLTDATCSMGVISRRFPALVVLILNRYSAGLHNEFNLEDPARWECLDTLTVDHIASLQATALPCPVRRLMIWNQRLPPDFDPCISSGLTCANAVRTLSPTVLSISFHSKDWHGISTSDFGRKFPVSIRCLEIRPQADSFRLENYLRDYRPLPLEYFHLSAFRSYERAPALRYAPDIDWVMKLAELNPTLRFASFDWAQDGWEPGFWSIHRASDVVHVRVRRLRFGEGRSLKVASFDMRPIES